MDIARIPPRAGDGHINVLVEIPRGSRNKYEYDEVLGVVKLDRVLYAAVHYPTDYGFIPGTRDADGERLDAMLLVEEAVFPGCLVAARLIGVLTIAHTDGKEERKLLGVPVREPRFAVYRDIGDVPGHVLTEIAHFSPCSRTWRRVGFNIIYGLFRAAHRPMRASDLTITARSPVSWARLPAHWAA
jgi:inorganic pyrophosphatase